MGYVVYGAGAVGAAIATALTDAGREVVVVARGTHGERLRRHGLRLKQPRGTRLVGLQVCTARSVSLNAGDVVVVAVKAQDAREVFDSIEAQCPAVTVITAQNGIENERWAAGRFAQLVGAMVWIPSMLLVPGEVAVYADDPMGAIRLGPWPRGSSTIAEEFAAGLSGHGFDAETVEDVQEWKHGKLLQNLGNVVDGYIVPDPGAHDPSVADLRRWATEEGERVLRAADLPFIPRERLFAEMNRRVVPGLIDGAPRPGGSTWQSVSRGKSSEVPFLNGSICRLGAGAGVLTPVNDALVALDREQPGPRSVSAAALHARIR